MSSTPRLGIHPLTAQRFRDLEHQLNGPGASQVRACGARLVEAYPVDENARSADNSMWFGSKAMYDRAGFAEVGRRKPTRPLVRKRLRTKRG